MTVSQKRGSIRHDIQEALDDWDVSYWNVKDYKDSDDRTLTFYVNLANDYDSDDVEGALESVCDDWGMDSWWDDDDDDCYVLECGY